MANRSRSLRRACGSVTVNQVLCLVVLTAFVVTLLLLEIPVYLAVGAAVLLMAAVTGKAAGFLARVLQGLAGDPR